nr:hypothetical protein [Tanacetum cinerariifolium]
DVLHRPAGAPLGCDDRGGRADSNDFLAAGVHQCRLRPQLRRHLNHPDFRADTTDLPGRGVLLDQPVATVLADRFAGQPGAAHGQRVPFRDFGCVRHQDQHRPDVHGRSDHRLVPGLCAVAGEWSRDAAVAR